MFARDSLTTCVLHASAPEWARALPIKQQPDRLNSQCCPVAG